MNNETISVLSNSVGGHDDQHHQDAAARHQGSSAGGANPSAPGQHLTKLDEESAWTNSMEYEHHDGDPYGIRTSMSGDGSSRGGHPGGEGSDRGVDSLLADLSCLCAPTCAKRPSEICGRSGGWALANADQFISSIIVAISLIPESISYALIAGLPPSSALQSCWITNVITAAIGGRPGMITSASGLAALLLARLVRTDTVVEETGIMFVPYVVMFAGVLKCVAAFFGFGRLVSSFPAPVVVGVVNAMAILILALQLRYAKKFPLTPEEMANGWRVDGTAPAADVTWNVSLFSYFGKGFDWISPALNLGIYAAEVVTAFVISMFLPKLTTFLPATLVSVLVVVAVEFGLARQFGVETPLISDYGGAQVITPWETVFTSKDFALPSLGSWESWKLILGYGFALFATEFTETAIALNVVDRLDESQGPGFLVLIGQGVANVVSGILGGMGGSGVVSMSVLADRTFGTTCLSTFMTGLMMFVFVTWGYPVINYIPLSAISGISIAMVCSFIQWRSMVATFTTCLPSRKRDQLPPQYNIARFDVFVMVIVTAACLIVDVATLLFFVMGLTIFGFTSIRGWCERRKEKKLMSTIQGEGVVFAHSDQVDESVEMGGDHVDPTEGGAIAGGQYAEEQQDFPVVDHQEMPSTQLRETANDESCPSLDCKLMESAEELIFPCNVKSGMQSGSIAASGGESKQRQHLS
mmetsp:Transcript_20385/g.43696  ORF Transcript_20385/g.43696 Transcript_20385/m.43696 type:complete len:698 (-) Transcript_20385:142-2235(-)